MQSTLTYPLRGLVALLVLCLWAQIPASAQNKTPKVQPVNISLQVTDEQGNPIPNAAIVVGEGNLHAETNESGIFSFQAMPENFITVSSYGYTKSVALVGTLVNNSVVELKKSKLFNNTEDEVPLPFMSFKRRKLSGAYSVLRTSDLEKYPTNDLRNSLTGLVPGLEVIERDGSTGLNAEEELGNFRVTEKIGLATRGRSPIFIIDDVPTDITEMPLDPQEIESVTIVKDIVGKAMLGPRGADGIIYIKTKRGKANERVLTVNAEQGVSQVDRFPGWASGAEYATLNNQARTNSGLTPLYDDAAISEYAKNDPYSFKYPSVDYRQLMLKDSKSFSRVNLASTGGNETVQYGAYLGYNGEGDIFKLGKISDYNRINVRSNIDVKINDLIKVKVDFFGGLNIRRSPNYGYNPNFTSDDGNTNTALDLVEFNSAIADITDTPPIAFPIYAAFGDNADAPWYAVSPNTAFRDNPIGNLVHNGYYNETGRTGASNLTFDYDLKEILPGLKSKTFVGFNIFNSVRIGKAENYIAYIATPGKTASGADTVTLSKVHDGTDLAEQAKLHDYYSQRFVVYENLSYEKQWGNHDVQVGATYYLGKISKNGIEEPQRQQNAVMTGVYSLKDKYFVQGVLNYAGTYSFAKGKRYAMFPAAGLGWVISEESFLSDVKAINYLKLRAEAGILGYESFLTPFLYLDRWGVNSSGSAFGPYSTNQWFGTNTDNSVYRTTANRIGNPDLTWEKRKEFSIGLDALLFNRKISVEANYYNNLRDGMVSQLFNTVPYTAGISNARPWFNYNKVRYYGLETSLQYSDKIGALRFSVGGNATVQNSKILKYDQANFRFDYQSIIGQPIDTYFGQTYMGKFASDAETLVVPQIYDETLQKDDLKYEDKNGDGVVDDNDRSPIGHTTPRLFYGLNLRVGYRNFDLTVIGTGRAGYDIPLTNKYFWNGWGDNNYSNFTKDNMDGESPRLTYYKVNNNFVASDFWLRNGSFFKIQNVELAYTVPLGAGNLMGIRGLRIYARGANLLTLSKIKDVDPESINSGVTVNPLFRTVSTGIKLTF
ncbi:SusC/RagA family TonB-linked outer membrane protein [Persicitalea jodogahamensis]|uniref:SusC/RagA family TonB-linked outer membrane protein n=1 Tax=Persicitalea jodogahamensis TaxID=402147 RepID=A0A8J3G840_9BACT|nr:SusC/RagA family TonB-linked outer membrane protein [Persicitalea jodogahamensis]GHB62563.1 SusC/RagA family TonB-linked outer membrane protein [Persicitalea jodogahamensis]